MPDDEPVEPQAEQSPETPESPEAETAPVETPEDPAPAADTNNTELPADGSPVNEQPPAAKPQKWWQRWLHKKRFTIPAVIVVLLAIILGLPFTRYKVLALVWKQSFDVTFTDSKTSKPITEASVKVGSASATTDKKGQAHVSGVPVGKRSVSITKKYYKDASQVVLVPLGKPAGFSFQLVATGRQVPITVTNKISTKAVENVLVKASDTQVRSDKDGKAVIVLPADKDSVKATISGDGYNSQDVTIKVTESEDKANTFSVTPAGKVYFLSKLSGKIDVIKTDLDGQNRQTVLAGTGKEEDTNTVLLASRDWKFLALQSRRDSDQAKLYLIDTSSDKLTTMDEGNVNFTLTGWQGHRFIYLVGRNDVKNWEPKAGALKSYSADAAKVTTLDETTAEGSSDTDYAHETISDAYSLTDSIIYTKAWTSYYGSSAKLADKTSKIISVQADGSHKTTLKSFGLPNGTQASSIFIQSRIYELNGIYYKADYDNNYYKYEDGQVSTATDLKSEDFYNNNYPTYLLSPDGQQTFWAESRDGKNTLFIGDQDGKQGKQIATLSEYSPYGWYSNDYLFVSKNSSELYIMPSAGGTALKVSDYHKPQRSYYGYGGGYGGI